MSSNLIDFFNLLFPFTFFQGGPTKSALTIWRFFSLAWKTSLKNSIDYYEMDDYNSLSKFLKANLSKNTKSFSFYISTFFLYFFSRFTFKKFSLCEPKLGHASLKLFSQMLNNTFKKFVEVYNIENNFYNLDFVYMLTEYIAL